MSRKSIVYSVIFTSVTALVLLAVPGLQDSAHAGVLLRSQRVTSRTNARPPRIRLGRVSSSTKVARRLNPISSRSIRGGSFNGVSSVLSYRKRQAKYQQRLYKFQVKQAKKEIKRRRKLERKREAKLRKERRALERKLRKMQAQQPQAKNPEQTAAARALSGTTAGENAVSADGQQSTKIEGSAQGQGRTKKKSFWSRLWMSLIGTSPSRR